MASRKLVLVVAVAALIAIVFVSGVAAGTFMARPSSKGTNEALSVEGVATIKLLAPDGRVVGVWTAHNTLVPSGIDLIALCASSGTCLSPGLTPDIWVGLNACTNSYIACGVMSTATNTPTPSGCGQSNLDASPPAPPYCVGWVASSTFSAAALACTSTCSLVDVASGNPGQSSFGYSLSYQFDDITGAALPSITISAGQSLAISIQFTVS